MRHTDEGLLQIDVGNVMTRSLEVKVSIDLDCVELALMVCIAFGFLCFGS